MFNPKMAFMCIPDGLVTDKRPLTSADKRVWAYVFTVCTLGATFEVQTKDEAIFNSINVGSQGRFLCTLDKYQQRTNFVFADFAAGADAVKPIVLGDAARKAS